MRSYFASQVVLLSMAIAASTAAHAAEPVGQTSNAASAPLTVSGERVQVAYLNLENFDEVQRDPNHDTSWAEGLGGYFVSRVQSALGEGQSLTVVITNMRLAGQYQPGMGSGSSNMRVVTPGTPPRMDLTFRLLAADGQVLSEGSRKLVDANFLTRRARHGGAHAYEKNLIDDFIRKEITEAPRQ
jgi:Protein of unknown function (DUF3016)